MIITSIDSTSVLVNNKLEATKIGTMATLVVDITPLVHKYYLYLKLSF